MIHEQPLAFTLFFDSRLFVHPLFFCPYPFLTRASRLVPFPVASCPSDSRLTAQASSLPPTAAGCLLNRFDYGDVNQSSETNGERMNLRSVLTQVEWRRWLSFYSHMRS